MKLKSTTIIKGTITLETGLHIGGSKTSLNIGGVDTPVIKTPLGIPYIPGSSFKGKVRTLLGLKEGTNSVKDDSDLLKKMFGFEGGNGKGNSAVAQLSRLIFRDAHLDESHFDKTFIQSNAILETDYTEVKFENTIERTTGKTNQGGLRQIERVPAGAIFNFEIVMNILEDDNEVLIKETLKDGLTMLQNNYLGGSGTRGYGKVSLKYELTN